ncbi:nuclear receptor coactivator 5 isoform X2 [Nilaparvata lugens]|uniref:nuclear receptor coactivator 5 isoform X2 n=1 Tax=Nilaparvata lugens TaxID=108931 RepID=UPI00193DBEB6|nr:nuclear receptor coactivator 5 isoform X2 [Nilaparvata lugens]
MGDGEYEGATKIIRDPSTVKSRIFIGNTPSNVTKKNLEDIFSPYGQIIAIVLNRGFAFLQFSNEDSANSAIEKECGTMCGGKKLDVKHAVVFKKNRNDDKDQDRGGRERSPIRERDDMNERMPMGGFKEQPFNRHEMVMRNERFGPGPGFGGDFPVTDYPMGVGNFLSGFMGMRENDGVFPQAENIFPAVNKGPFPDRQAMMGPRESFRPHNQPANIHTDRINDCEIIVLNRSITMGYADYIERRLKEIGLTVDVLFPNDDVPLGRILANISGRGALYAIVITPTNEQHRSLTVNILYGQHQEHRNMPLEDAVSLIRRTFQSYMRGERELPGTIGGYEVHPDAIQTLFNLLKENRQLTVLQYDKVIRYLQDKREKQLKLEVGDDASDLPSLKESNSNSNSASAAVPVVKQQELQSRIMNILKKKGAVPAADEAPAPVPAPDQWRGAASEPPANSHASSANTHVPSANQQQQQQPPAPLLNPNVQKAIDSLLSKGDLLRSLNPKSAQPVPAPQPMFSAYAPNRKY